VFLTSKYDKMRLAGHRPYLQRKLRALSETLWLECRGREGIKE